MTELQAFYGSYRNWLEVKVVEAGGIEPPSRDNSNGGLYMHSRLFNLGAGGGKRHPPPEPSRLYLVR